MLSPLLLLVLPSLTARAQDVTPPVPSPDVNAQLYRIPIDAERTLWTDDSAAAPTGYWRAKLGLAYARNPLTYRSADGSETAILANALQGDLIGAVSLSRLRIGLDLPIWLLTDGDTIGGGGGLGDIALDLKGTAISRENGPVGLAFGARFDLPTSTVDAPVGNPGLGWALQVIADAEAGPMLFAANLGTQGVPPTDLGAQEWDDQFFYRLGAGLSLAEDNDAGLSLDLAGRAAYGGLGASGSPLEAMLGGWTRLGESFVLRPGVGTGITKGFGSPDFRGVLTLGYEPRKVTDRDGDGILDKVDQCRNQPEDFDQFQDSDGCPDPKTAVKVVVVDAKNEPVLRARTSVKTPDGTETGGAELTLELHPGSYQVEISAPRFAGKTVTFEVPEDKTHEVRVKMASTFGKVDLTVTDPDGQPLDASVRVLEGDVTDAPGGRATFEAEEGDRFLIVQAPGFKPARVPVTVIAGKTAPAAVQLESSRAKVTKAKIEILDKVYFDTNKATIQPTSFGILGEVAALLDANPDVKKIRIEGHTDNRGAADDNRELSQARADAVKAWLVAQGIAAGRMDSVGYGEDQPVNPANNAKAWDLNRRVEFVIVEREE